MDGFQSYAHQPAVTMGNFVSTLLQLKSQVELIDQFLSLYVPDYVQLKNYATEYQQANLFGGPFPGTVPSASVPEHVMSSFLGDQGAANSKAGEEDSANASGGKGKTRRKQPLAKKVATNNPANLKRRGRKRKYPLPNPNEDSVETAQHVPGPPTVQFPVNLVQASVPVPFSTTATHIFNENSLNNQLTPTESSDINHNHHDSAGRTMSGLDVLAAISFVIKQNGMNGLPGARDVPSNFVTRNENNNTSDGGGISLIQKIKQEPIEQDDQQQDCDENRQEYETIPGAEVRVEGQELQQANLLQLHNQPQYQKQTNDHLVPLTQQSALPHIPQNAQECVTVGPSEHVIL